MRLWIVFDLVFQQADLIWRCGMYMSPLGSRDMTPAKEH